MTNEQIAEVCYEANRALCRSHDDFSFGPWAEAPQWQRDTNIAGVVFCIANPNAGDSASHDSWMRAKLADGWQYGPTKDAEAKLHPCIMPFEDLPAHQQVKDKLFRAIVAALAP